MQKWRAKFVQKQKVMPFFGKTFLLAAPFHLMEWNERRKIHFERKEAFYRNFLIRGRYLLKITHSIFDVSEVCVAKYSSSQNIQEKNASPIYKRQYKKIRWRFRFLLTIFWAERGAEHCCGDIMFFSKDSFLATLTKEWFPVETPRKIPAIHHGTAKSTPQPVVVCNSTIWVYCRELPT